LKRCNFICEECKAPYKEKHFFKECFPCCSLPCFEQYTHRINQKVLREAGLTQKAKELELERFREIAGIQCQSCKSASCICKAIDAFCEVKDQTKEQKMESLKDFSIFTTEQLMEIRELLEEAIKKYKRAIELSPDIDKRLSRFLRITERALLGFESIMPIVSGGESYKLIKLPAGFITHADNLPVSTPSLKDFIGKECSVFGKGLGLGKGLLNGEFINQKQYNFIYMGSDDVCHIIQRKVDGEPDGIFFFPKAAVGLRF
jgi:hypothetical protein